MMDKYKYFNSWECPFPNGENNEDASSEMIGSIILIGIFVVAFGIILVALLSSQSQFVVPAVVIEHPPVIEDNDTYVLVHRAGDTLLRKETRILVDGTDMTGNFSSSDGGLDWNRWGIGDSLSLALNGNVPAESVQVIYYHPEGSGILLWDAG